MLGTLCTLVPEVFTLHRISQNTLTCAVTVKVAGDEQPTQDEQRKALPAGPSTSPGWRHKCDCSRHVLFYLHWHMLISALIEMPNSEEQQWVRSGGFLKKTTRQPAAFKYLLLWEEVSQRNAANIYNCWCGRELFFFLFYFLIQDSEYANFKWEINHILSCIVSQTIISVWRWLSDHVAGRDTNPHFIPTTWSGEV